MMDYGVMDFAILNPILLFLTFGFFLSDVSDRELLKDWCISASVK